MNIEIERGKLRGRIARSLVCFFYLASVFTFGIDLTLFALCLCAKTLVCELKPVSLVAVDFDKLHYYWQIERAICFYSKQNKPQWILRDEVAPETFAMLRRKAKLNLPRQPVGLSISK